MYGFCKQEILLLQLLVHGIRAEGVKTLSGAEGLKTLSSATAPSFLLVFRPSCWWSGSPIGVSALLMVFRPSPGVLVFLLASGFSSVFSDLLWQFRLLH